MPELPCWSVHLMLDSGPVVAFGYSVGVWFMYSMAHEFTWTSRVPQVLGRASWLVSSVATSIGVCNAGSSLSLGLPLCAAFGVGSAVLCRWTRVCDVVGVPEAPYFGSRHMQHKNVLITGANSGIGKETVIQLASMGATVYLLCRSAKRAQEAVDSILNEHAQTIEPSQLKVVTMDLGDFASIRKAVDEDLKDIKVDVLINNAGLMMGSRTLSKDGHEMMMQANHFGHFLLANLIQAKHLFAKDARVINLTSSTHKLVNQTGFDFDDMMCEGSRSYSLFFQYAHSKLANILFTKQWIREFPEYAAFAVHPGLVRTNVTSNMPWLLQFLNKMFAWIVGSMQKRPSEGAYSSVLCATAPLEQLPPPGSYIVNCKAEPLSNVAESTHDAERLWQVSKELVGL
eukprot:Nitzschia sp. Nitz4//scaffold452_size12107//9473//10669//NITZ4_008999-RA/size12107-processed-gene-0.1-mRNA-1//1//CDS//3329552265//175//frame0